MRILMLGRPPGVGWIPPGTAEIVVCGEGLPSAPWYDTVPVPDLTDLEQVLFALTHAGRLEFDAVYCDHEHAMVNAAVVAGVVGASRAMSIPMALLGRDKLRQKQLVARAGLPTATVDLVPVEARPRAGFAPSAPYPVIVKPVFGSAVRGVRRVDSAADLPAALTTLANREPVLCEEFVGGTEYHLDAAIAGGRLALLSVGRYLTNIMDTGLASPTGSCVLPVEGNESIYDRAQHLVTASLEAFRFTDGVVHLEAFDSATGLVYSECGFRRAGGKITDAVAAGTETDYRRTSCLASLGMLLPAPLRRPHRAAAWIMFKVEPGVLKRMPDDDDFAAVRDMWQVSLRRDLVGSYVPAMDGVYQNIGFALVTAPDSGMALTELQRAATVFHEGVVVSPRLDQV
jgi:hypothetical protein